jgi:serine phosphatase RsbU (regulator of sigma subunit)
LPLGIDSGENYGDMTETLNSGDVLVFYTDGVTEARRQGELFGEDRLAEVVAGAGPSVEDVVSAVEEAVAEFGRNDRADDVALLAISPGP